MEKSIFVCAALSAALIACGNNPAREAPQPVVMPLTVDTPCQGRDNHCILITIEDSATPRTIEVYPHSKELRGRRTHQVFWLLDDTDAYIFHAQAIPNGGVFSGCTRLAVRLFRCFVDNAATPDTRNKYQITLVNRNNPADTIVLDPFIVNR